MVDWDRFSTHDLPESIHKLHSDSVKSSKWVLDLVWVIAGRYLRFLVPVLVKNQLLRRSELLLLIQ